MPKGLLYTTAFSPIFFYNSLKAKRKTYWIPFGIFLIFYDVVHLLFGVDISSFLLSNALFIFTYFFVIACYHFVNNYSANSLGKLFKQILVFNGVMVLIAIPFFFLPRNYQEWFWYFNPFTRGVSDFPRLALLTYEASYYSLLLVPVVFYYTLKILFKSIHNNKGLTIILVFLPLLLSFSLGVIGAMLITAILMCFIFRKDIFRYKRTFLLFYSVLFILIGSTTILFIYFPQNFFVIRMQNILNGTDTSTNGRTIESFTMAWKIADSGNVFFGVGLGQIKIIIAELVRKYYNYWGNFPRYDIPNAMGETLAIFGLSGVAIRLTLQIWLFFKTKVFLNYYRLSLFLFIFIYQFTGSFITNSVEYVIWILVFSDVFKQFDIIRND